MEAEQSTIAGGAPDPLNDSPAASTVGKRWKLLASAIRRAARDTTENVAAANSDVSVMRFKSFGLIVKSTKGGGVRRLNVDDDQLKDDGYTWVTYASTVETCPFAARIRIIQAPTSLSAMMGFNNTGNVCVWPSEEVLAYYCLCNLDQFVGKRVCELGSGMTGLAGLAVAMTSSASEVLLTDGNEASVQNLDACVQSNIDSFGKTCVASEVLIWDRKDEFIKRANRFDVLIAADCLFFTDYHIDLLHVIVTLLRPNGHAIIIGPHRSGTLKSFVEMVENSDGTRAELVENFDSKVTACHLDAVEIDGKSGAYDPNIHQPILLKVIKL